VPTHSREVFKESLAALKGLLKEIEGVRLCSRAQRGADWPPIEWRGCALIISVSSVA